MARGMVAFLRVAASLAAARQPRPPAPSPARETPSALDAEIVRVWSRMVLAHANSP
ncbi:hypothetical protein ABZ468_53390 [Streptomyces sp. NPDC005708]|uniref:hypothetical protein n=1 Tax=Streptomyces sp. NPDC005708 TaxID=3154564 RepID=UPI00340AED4B